MKEILDIYNAETGNCIGTAELNEKFSYKSENGKLVLDELDRPILESRPETPEDIRIWASIKWPDMKIILKERFEGDY